MYSQNTGAVNWVVEYRAYVPVHLPWLRGDEFHIAIALHISSVSRLY
jgi:hypothetical protein